MNWTRSESSTEGDSLDDGGELSGVVRTFALDGAVQSDLFQGSREKVNDKERVAVPAVFFIAIYQKAVEVW